MKGFGLKTGIVALIACAVTSQGCLVPFGKYVALKRKYEEAVRELAAKDSQLADANTRIDLLNKQLDANNQIVKLYQDKKKEADELAARLKAQLDGLNSRLEEIAKTHGPGVELKDGTLIIKDQLLFPTGSAEVSEQGQKLLEDVANKFKATNEIIQIDGHTDNVRVAKPETVAKFVSNWGLSAMRARAVLELLAKYGIPENRMYLRAFSMTKPRADNATDDGKSKNRRVEVMFIPAEVLAPKAEE